LSIVSLLSAPTVTNHPKQRVSALGSAFGTLHHDDVVKYARELWLPPALRGLSKTEAPSIEVVPELRREEKTSVASNQDVKANALSEDLPSKSKAAFGEVATHAAQAAATFSTTSSSGQVQTASSTFVLPWKDEFVCLHHILALVSPNGSKLDLAAFSSQTAHRCISLIETLLASIDSNFALHATNIESSNR
jgi:hypothetical protein